MKKKVLIYPCGTEIGMEMWESLRHSKHFEVFGANGIDCAGFRLYDKGHRAILEKLEDIGLLCELWEIDIVLPAHDQVQYNLCKILYDDKRVVLPDLSTVGVTRSKTRTYHTFHEISPIIVDTFPAFVKPDRGQGSRGARICHNAEELSAIEREFGEVVQTEILEGPEYTVDCFTDRHGHLRYVQARDRTETRGGISVNTTFVQDQSDWLKAAVLINKRLKMRGAWFFQIKGGKLLEIAPRIAGSSGINRAYGVNLTELTIWDFLGHDVTVPVVEPRGRKAMRRLDTKIFGVDFVSVYVDIDDTLFVDGNPNPDMVAMLHRWRNNGKHVHLITRSKDYIYANRAKLFGLDLPCSHVKQDEPKSKFINPYRAIFVDDSFAEREEVRRALGIPVFGPESAIMLA